MNSETISADESTSASKVDGKIRPKLVKWSSAAILAAFCIYRLANFKPQPLDSPNTLRPFLFQIFNWFLGFYGTPEKFFDSWSKLSLLVLWVPLALAFLHYLEWFETVRLPLRVRAFLSSRSLFFATIAVALLFCRFPYLVQNELNPDEGEFLFSAHKLFYSGYYFRSVDCYTSGPLNIYPLMLPAIFGLSPDFASSRLLGLLAIFLTAYFLYRAFTLISNEKIARLAILPILGVFCTFENTELLHMSSEHLPVLLIAISVYLGVQVLVRPMQYRKHLFLLGLTGCAAFFTKLQSVPVIAAIVVVAIVYAHVSGCAERAWKPALWFCAGTLPLLLLNALFCSITGVWKDFWIGYIISNWTYSGGQSTISYTLPSFFSYVFSPTEIRLFVFTFLGLCAAFVFQRRRLGRIHERTTFLRLLAVSGLTIGIAIFLRESLPAPYGFLLYIALAAIPVYSIAFFQRPHIGLDRHRWFGVLAIALILGALFAVYMPHHPFFHYLLFLLPAMCVAIAWMLMTEYEAQLPGPGNNGKTYADRSRAAFVLVFMALTAGYQSYIWTLPSVEPHGNTRVKAFQQVQAVIRPPEGDFIRSLTSPGARIAVWGWTARPYLGSGRVPAIRDTHILYCFRQDQLKAYYTHRWLKDMQRRPPDLFIDAVGPTSWFLTDPNAFNFQQFTEIAGFVNANYVHLADLYGQHYFLRHDLAARRDALFSAPLPVRDCAPDALSCSSGAITLPKAMSAVQIPEHALLEAEFMPVQPQIGQATIFSNAAAPDNHTGFRFRHTTGDRYSLLVGTGRSWVISKEFTLRAKEPVWLTIEFDGRLVRVRCNNSQSDELHLSRPMVNSTGPVNLNSWIESANPFAGKMQFFQILDLQRKQKSSVRTLRR